MMMSKLVLIGNYTIERNKRKVETCVLFRRNLYKIAKNTKNYALSKQVPITIMIMSKLVTTGNYIKEKELKGEKLNTCFV